MITTESRGPASTLRRSTAHSARPSSRSPARNPKCRISSSHANIRTNVAETTPRSIFNHGKAGTGRSKPRVGGLTLEAGLSTTLNRARVSSMTVDSELEIDERITPPLRNDDGKHHAG